MFDFIFEIPKMTDDEVREKLKHLSDDKLYIEQLVKIADGNIGAVTAIKDLHEVGPMKAAIALGLCEAWNIQGSMLWLLYKDVCNEDANETLKIIERCEAQDKLEALHYSGYKRP